jgi:hypothetical protein
MSREGRWARAAGDGEWRRVRGGKKPYQEDGLFQGELFDAAFDNARAEGDYSGLQGKISKG